MGQPELEIERWSFTDGQSSEAEVCELLYALIRAEKPSLAVEIGAYRGMATEAMGFALARNGAGGLHAFERDPDLAEIVRRRCQGLPVRVYPEWDFAVDKEWVGVGFLFIDGEDRRETLARWLPRMAPAGLIAIHDTLHRDPSYTDPREAVESVNWVQWLDIITPHGLTLCRAV